MSPFFTLLLGTRTRQPVIFSYGTHFSRWKGLFKITALPAHLFPSLWLFSFCYPQPSFIFHSFSSGLASISTLKTFHGNSSFYNMSILSSNPLLFFLNQYFSRAQGLSVFQSRVSSFCLYHFIGIVSSESTPFALISDPLGHSKSSTIGAAGIPAMLDLFSSPSVKYISLT